MKLPEEKWRSVELCFLQSSGIFLPEDLFRLNFLGLIALDRFFFTEVCLQEGSGICSIL
jgi:hypothetical protein